MLDIALPTARDWMTQRVLTLAPDQELFNAIDLLLSNSFAAAPVVDDKDNLLGMLTEKDCLRVLSNLTYDEDLQGGLVQDYHSAIRIDCEPHMDLFQVAEMFLGTNFPLLPVVEKGRLCGVISRRDMLRGIRAFRAEVMKKKAAIEKDAGHQADRPRSIESMQRTVANRTTDQLVRLMGRSKK